MLNYKNFMWAWRLIGTRTFGKFVPNVTFFPIGEFLNHDNTETFYCYVSPTEKADSTGRYDGDKPNEDHDDKILEKDVIMNFSHSKLLQMNTHLTISIFGDNSAFTSVNCDAMRLDAEIELDKKHKDD